MTGIAVLACAYVLSQFYRSFLAVLTPMLSADLGMSSTDLSLASGLWFATFALMQFPVGVSLDRYGPRRTAGILLGVGCGGGTLLFALATGPWMIIAGMMLIGIGCAPVLMAAMFIFAKNFRPSLFAVAASWLMAIGTAGNVISATPLALVSNWLGWRGAMGAMALASILVAVLVMALVRDPARDSDGDAAGFSGFMEVARLRVIWPILPFLMLNSSIANGIRGLWSGPFLFEVHGADAVVIGNVTFFMALSMVAGSFVFGPLDTLLGTRKWVVAAGGIMGIGASLYLAANPDASLTALTIAFMFAGASVSTYGVLMAHLRAFLPSHLIGRGVTAMNFIAMGGVGLMQVVTGQLVRLKTDPADPVHAYATLFAFYAIVVASALLIYLFSRDAKPGELTAQAAAGSTR